MDTAKLDAELNQKVLSGQALEAFEEFYAEDVIMIEGNGERHEGKDANRTREQEFFASVEEVHAFELLGSATSGNRSYSEWLMDVTLKGMGRVKMEQAAVRDWRDGKVVKERFYYNAG